MIFVYTVKKIKDLKNELNIYLQGLTSELNNGIIHHLQIFSSNLNVDNNNNIEIDDIDNFSENYFKVEKQSKYPKVIRDFSFILNDGIKFIELQELISNTSKLIKKIDLVDVYKGSQIDNAKKSYSISVTLEEKKKTLDEIEINRISDKIIKSVNKELNGEIRS